MARKTSRRLKVSEIAISQAAFEAILKAGGDILAMKIIRKLQTDWPTYPHTPGMVTVVKLTGPVDVYCLFPIAGRTGVAILTEEEAERSKRSIQTGLPDEITLRRVMVA